ncbi:MAG: P-II family nitrogen regulator [Clostridiaceae bacterium]|nr:P-II family nitrogen regulator [Clostridiaceae bacterium]
MKKLEMVIRPEKLEDIKEILNRSMVHGMTVTMVSGCGHQKGRREVYRGTEISLNLLPKVKVETIVKDDLADTLINEIVDAIKTGQVGDGKIFVSPIEDAIRIRTGEHGEKAL